MPHPDYNYVASVAVASDGPAEATLRGGPSGTRRSRDGAKLAHTDADARYWHEEFKREAPRVDFHVLLVEPTRLDVLVALYNASLAVEAFSHESDWGGGQVNFAFAGHGSEAGDLILRDGGISAADMLEAILAPARENRVKRRVAVVLDSCHAARVLTDFVVDGRQKTDFLLIDGFAASMHDELAWELDGQGHGALTFGMAAKTELLSELLRGTALRNAGSIASVHERAAKAATLLTERDQTPVEVINGWHIEAHGGGHIDLDADLSVPVVLSALVRARAAEPNTLIPINSS